MFSSDPFFIVIALVCLGVLGILLFGLLTFAKGGEFNLRNSNRIMRWRIYVQAVAVVLLVVWAWMRSGG